MRMYLSRMALVAGLLTLTGCATFTEQFSAVERHLADGRPEQALQVMEKDPGPERDRVLYLLNRGVLLQKVGRLVESNESLEQAKLLMRQLAATSVSETAGSLTINDATRSYIGDPHEQVMVHMFMALNYLELGERDNARVEALQMDVRLRELQQGSKSAYLEDAFGRYLAGIIYEELGEYSDAMISYRKAYEAYDRQMQDFAVPVPEELKLALVRMSQRIGLNDEHKAFRERFNITQFASVAELRKQGRLVFIFGNGLAPPKLEHSITLRDYSRNQLHRVAMPYYATHQTRILLGGARLQSGERVAETGLVENVDAIARKSLEEQMPLIEARALARVVAKSAMVRETKRNNDDHPLVGLLMNIATVATERADTRSWITLPSEFYLGSLSLQPGSSDVTVQLLGQRGGVVDTLEYKEMAIAAGQNQYRFYHWISPADGKRKAP